MISILFICNGSALKCSGKACKINDFRKREALTTQLLHHLYLG